MKRHTQARFVIIGFTLMVWLISPWSALTCFSQDKEKTDVVVLVSKRIRPYAEALKGADAVFKEKEITYRSIWVKDDTGAIDSFRATLAGLNPELLLTIGPEALILADSLMAVSPIPVVHSVVLNPDTIIGEKPFFCGISLEIPLERQIADISGILPDIKTVGLLFDPKYNQHFYEQACGFCTEMNIRIIPLSVSSKTQIPTVLDTHWDVMDAVWMIPDRTVISERIVQYIIRKAITKRTPVIGFNRFFYESGAVMVFEFDYQDLGVQAARLAVRRLMTGVCTNRDPVYSLSVNEKVAQKIRVRVLGQAGEGGAW